MDKRGESGRRAAAWAVGALALATFSAGVASALSWTGDGRAHPAVGVAAEVTTTTVVEEATTTSTVPAPTTTLPPATTTTVTLPRVAVATTVTFATISGRVLYHSAKPVEGAKLTLAGHTVFTDGDGRYRFDRVPRGEYDLLLWAESGSPACVPGQPCIGSAIAVERRPITVSAGETHTEDWVYPYDDPPMYSDQATTTR